MQRESDTDDKNFDTSQSKAVQIQKGKNSKSKMSNVPDLKKQIVVPKKAECPKTKTVGEKKVVFLTFDFYFEFYLYNSIVYNFWHRFKIGIESFLGLSQSTDNQNITIISDCPLYIASSCIAYTSVYCTGFIFSTSIANATTTTTTAAAEHSYATATSSAAKYSSATTTTIAAAERSMQMQHQQVQQHHQSQNNETIYAIGGSENDVNVECDLITSISN